MIIFLTRRQGQHIMVALMARLPKKHRKTKLARRFRRWFLNSWLLHFAFTTSVWILGKLPLSVSRCFGRWGGWIAYHLDRGHRTACLDNMAIAFPERSPAQHRALAKANYIHLGLCAVDFCQLQDSTAEDIRNYWIVPEPGARERLQAALTQGRGAIGVGAHIGFWELTGFALPSLGFPLTSVARRMASPRLQDCATRFRTRFGNTVIPQEGALQHVLKTLRANKMVGINMDQYAGAVGPWLPFFAREASTVSSCAWLHLRTGAPLLCNLMIRRPDGRYTWRCRNIDVPAVAGENREEHVLRILTECNRDFESVIRECPEQWLWMHRRWKPRPLPKELHAGSMAPIAETQKAERAYDAAGQAVVQSINP